LKSLFSINNPLVCSEGFLMPDRTYKVTENGKLGLEIRLNISPDESRRIMANLKSYHDEKIPDVTVIDFRKDQNQILCRSASPCNKKGVYFFATQDKEGVQILEKGKSAVYVRKKDVLVFEFVMGDRTKAYLDRFLESVGYKSNTLASDEEQKREARKALDRSLQPVKYRRHAEKPKHS
jgi:hypothetical protein